ncbi:MAG: bifunctional metallophosphatase/5'-nucleotidase [Odoribacter sp.]|nr:bifunctional metallophosphatase/5'-nucleotidase [Odoribacter sp.]
MRSGFRNAKWLFFMILIVLILLPGCKSKSISILETTDVHGVLLPYDFIEKQPLDASLASAATYIRQMRNKKTNILLLDNGDNLQGQPEEYYYNFIDTISPHFNAEVMNYMGYEAGTVGNHDIEAGHSVYDRLRKLYKFPLLAANAVDPNTGQPYFKPYAIIKKRGLKIAVFGLVTPAIPTWLPPQLYSGMEFRDMLKTAKKWMPEILNQKPDLVVGLFHSGWNRAFNEESSDTLNENGSAEVAYYVPGFDVIFIGHDHNTLNEKFVNYAGDTVLILDGGSRAQEIAQADIVFGARMKGGKRTRIISGTIVKLKDFKPDKEFLTRFSSQDSIIRKYVDKKIGESTTTVSSRSSYFGSSGFIDMIHSIQMEITGAEISFAAPLSFDVSIPKGQVTVGDMFKLYRYENLLYTMRMSGSEVLKYLEYSYAGWYNTMKGANDLLLNYRLGKDGRPLLYEGRARLRNQSYNFDSASGINYIVDVSKPGGERIYVSSFSDGRPFEKEKIYRVAVNSYRGNGGGGHFTEGVGLSSAELRSRLISSTDKDLRFYIIKAIEKRRIIAPSPNNNWKIIPVDWVKKAIPRDSVLLFGTSK